MARPYRRVVEAMAVFQARLATTVVCRVTISNPHKAVWPMKSMTWLVTVRRDNGEQMERMVNGPARTVRSTMTGYGAP